MDDQEQFEPGITEEEKPKVIEFTMQQRLWLKTYMETGNRTKAALVAYYPDFPVETTYSELSEEQKKTYDNAAHIGWENYRKLQIPISRLMDEVGLDDVYLMTKLKENLNATRLYGMNSDEHMDGPARNKALETALKMKDKLIDRVDHTTRGKTLLPKIKSDLSPDPAAEDK